MPDRLGAGLVCQNNTEKFMECDRKCEHNAHVTNRTTTSHMLKYHVGKQWGLHATENFKVGDWIDEYRGEMVSGEEGARRKRSKTATTPSYLLRVADRFLDAERFGNTTRFINHVCVEPNCRFEQVWVEGRLHISVIAL